MGRVLRYHSAQVPYSSAGTTELDMDGVGHQLRCWRLVSHPCGPIFESEFVKLAFSDTQDFYSSMIPTCGALRRPRYKFY